MEKSEAVFGKTVEIERYRGSEPLWLAGMSHADVEEELLRERAELESKIRDYETREKRHGLDVDAEFELAQMHLDYEDLCADIACVSVRSEA